MLAAAFLGLWQLIPSLGLVSTIILPPLSEVVRALWELVTAAQLHIHHNTLRYRIGRIATLSGRDAETTAGRVDFALALAIAA